MGARDSITRLFSLECNLFLDPFSFPLFLKGVLFNPYLSIQLNIQKYQRLIGVFKIPPDPAVLLLNMILHNPPIQKHRALRRTGVAPRGHRNKPCGVTALAEDSCGEQGHNAGDRRPVARVPWGPCEGWPSR